MTSALPYANGSLHLGHMVGYIQADIWVRLQKMLGHDCIYVCGSDSHGTPIMIKAGELGITPESLIQSMKAEHEQDFIEFSINFDNYYTTHSPENKALVSTIFERQSRAGHIEKHTINQLYDPVKQMFLPDRYIKGECPTCHAKDQYGDNCEVCGATYTPTELLHPYSTLTGVAPIEKQSEHYFFKLNDYEEFLKEWTRKGHLQDEVSNKLDEWFKSGLKEWDISRDAPYFGFTIPGETNKYFYVWLDAPVGYIASFKNLCDRGQRINFDEYWGADSQTELYHFIGKDIIYFHALFWPAILSGANFRTPTAIFVNGFLTINGQKMSKSRGTFIQARTYLNHLPAEFLRYYFAAKLNHRIEDIDINFDDFSKRINADLVGKFVNIASRCAGFITKNFAGLTSPHLAEPELYEAFVSAGDEIAEKYLRLEYSQALRHIMQLADRANQYIDEKKPWILNKDPQQSQQVQDVCSMALHLFRVITIYLKPVLPVTAAKIEAFLNIGPLNWQDRYISLLNHRINEYQPLINRIDPQQLEALNMSLQTQAETTTQPASATCAEEAADQFISIEDFNKIELRVARVDKAEHIEGADKLLRLQLDLGEEKLRQVFAGIKSSYEPETLVGRLVLMVANLAPRKMRFGISEGMVIVAKDEKSGKLFLVSPEEGAKPGMQVR